MIRKSPRMRASRYVLKPEFESWLEKQPGGRSFLRVHQVLMNGWKLTDLMAPCQLRALMSDARKLLKQHLKPWSVVRYASVSKLYEDAVRAYRRIWFGVVGDEAEKLLQVLCDRTGGYQKAPDGIGRELIRDLEVSWKTATGQRVRVRAGSKRTVASQ